MTAPDLTTMLRDTLGKHRVDGWACVCGWPLNDSVGSVQDHLSAVLAATVRHWLGNEPANEAVAGALLSNYASEYTADHLNSSDFTDDAHAVLAALVQQIGDSA